MEYMDHNISEIKEVIFYNKQNIPWNEVEQYLKRYIGQTFVVQEYQDVVIIASDFPDEYTGSRYTKKLRGALAKVKANAAQIIDRMIQNATNRRWNENREDKHRRNASEGWYQTPGHIEITVCLACTSPSRLFSWVSLLTLRVQS